LMTATVIDADDLEPLADADAVALAYGNALDLILDGGPTPGEPTTVLRLTSDRVELLRRGRGPVGDWAEPA